MLVYDDSLSAEWIPRELLSAFFIERVLQEAFLLHQLEMTESALLNVYWW